MVNIYLYSLLSWLVIPVESLSINRYDCTVSSATCNFVPAHVSIARLSQRDVSYNASIDQVASIGLDLTTAVFAPLGYTTDSLTGIEFALAFGYNSLTIDAYWSQRNNNWQLCPVAFPPGTSSSGINYQLQNGNSSVTCQANVTLDSVYEVVAGYISRSDTNLAVNLVLIYLQLHSMQNDTHNNIQGDMVLSTNLTNAFGNRIFTPGDLQNDRNTGMVSYGYEDSPSAGYPSLHYFLLTERKRVIITASNYSMTNGSTYSLEHNDAKTMFINNSPLPLLQGVENSCSQMTSSWPSFIDSVGSTSQIPFRSVYDTPTVQYTNESLELVTDCGYSPVVNSEVADVKDLVPIMENAFWSWAPYEPATVNGSSTNKPTAYQCAQLFSDGWHVANCYEQRPVLCRPINVTYEWIIGERSASYFTAASACPQGTHFSVPVTPLENTAARLTVSNSNNVTFPVWIDLNSIAVTSCWVTGGPFSTCPYQRASSNRNGVGLLAVACAVSFLLIVLMILLTFRKIPLRRNQARWRRLVNKFAETDYEGVPA
jgi:hypothetical protein